VNGDFNKVISNVKKLINMKREYGIHKPRIIWQYIVFKHNEYEIIEAREMA